MKKIILVLASILLVSNTMMGCTKEKVTNNAVDYTAIPREVKTTQFFSDDDVPEADVQKILEAGVNAPSAMNTQPWHFTAVTDAETAQKLADAMGRMMPPA